MPTWKFSGPPAPVRMMAGRATEPSSALPTRLNCCCTTVDLKRVEIPGKEMLRHWHQALWEWQLSLFAVLQALLEHTPHSTSVWQLPCSWKTYFFGDTESSSIVDSSSPSSPKWSLLFFCKGKEKMIPPSSPLLLQPRHHTRVTGSPCPASTFPSSTHLPTAVWRQLEGTFCMPLCALLSTASPF